MKMSGAIMLKERALFTYRILVENITWVVFSVFSSTAIIFLVYQPIEASQSAYERSLYLFEREHYSKAADVIDDAIDQLGVNAKRHADILRAVGAWSSLDYEESLQSLTDLGVPRKDLDAAICSQILEGNHYKKFDYCARREPNFTETAKKTLSEALSEYYNYRDSGGLDVTDASRPLVNREELSNDLERDLSLLKRRVAAIVNTRGCLMEDETCFIRRSWIRSPVGKHIYGEIK